MTMNPKQFPQRKSPRLQGYDYSQAGAYFVSICAHQRQLLFGTIQNGQLKYEALGQIVHDIWQTIPQHKSTVELDYFVVMPNHFHGILILGDNSPKLGTIVGHFKAAVTRIANRQLQYETRIWQDRYYDNIIRNEQMLNTIRQYVISNLAKWNEDEFYL